MKRSKPRIRKQLCVEMAIRGGIRYSSQCPVCSVIVHYYGYVDDPRKDAYNTGDCRHFVGFKANADGSVMASFKLLPEIRKRSKR